MIHVFHGFLGSPDDFSFLNHKDIYLHDLYQMTALPVVHESDTLIGYSMGGRLALELARSCRYHLKRLVLLSAHPGPSSEEERKDRKEFELKVVEELRNKDRRSFLNWWNALPVFSTDEPITTSEERYLGSADLFLRHRLSEQDNHIGEMKCHKDKVLYITGLNDEKYHHLATTVLIPEGIDVKFMKSGHRLFQQKKELTDLLLSEGVL